MLRDRGPDSSRRGLGGGRGSRASRMVGLCTMCLLFMTIALCASAGVENCT